MRAPPPQEQGYALVAAVVSIAIFASIAATIVAASRGRVSTVSAEIAQARAGAAADAGLALALHGLLSKDPSERWSIDGRVRVLDFGGARLTVRVQSERGKVPINLIEEGQVIQLLQLVGLQGERLKVASDSLQDWIDDDDETRADGAERAYYAPSGIAPHNGSMLSLGELARIRGFDKATVERLRPFVTVNYGSGGFDPRNAQPQALAIMTEGGEDSPEAIERERELAGQVTAIELATDEPLVGKPLTIIVDAAYPDGGHARRTQIVELTGSPARPYVVRSYE
jgi:general secretion pathway protein K